MKNMSRLLALTLAVMMLLAMALTASAAETDHTRFYLPITVSRMAAQLPPAERMPTVRTKTADGVINFSISESVDKVVAQWMGYGEEYEVLNLDSANHATISLMGHKYQLGAKWNNQQYHSYYINYGKVNQQEIKVYGVLEDVFEDGDVWYITSAWVWDPAEDDYVAFITPAPKTVYVWYLEDEPYLDLEDYENNMVEPMVNANQVTKIVYGKESNGAPNRAYSVTKGPWNAIYARSGKLVEYTKTESNTDYFKTGLAGSNGTVTWKMRWGNNGSDVWYIAEVTENYTDGDIASLTAQFDMRGQVEHYYVSYRDGKGGVYKIRYDGDDNAQYGNYTGKDLDGMVINAFTASRTSWADRATGKLSDSADLNWELIPFLNNKFQLPPRIK